MEDLEDELDLRYHKGLNPDVYYRCPTLEVTRHSYAEWTRLRFLGIVT
jgi:hypothetical protein